MLTGVRSAVLCPNRGFVSKLGRQAKELATAVRKEQRYHRRQHEKYSKDLGLNAAISLHACLSRVPLPTRHAPPPPSTHPRSTRRALCSTFAVSTYTDISGFGR